MEFELDRSVILDKLKAKDAYIIERYKKTLKQAFDEYKKEFKAIWEAILKKYLLTDIELINILENEEDTNRVVADLDKRCMKLVHKVESKHDVSIEHDEHIIRVQMFYGNFFMQYNGKGYDIELSVNAQDLLDAVEK